MPKLTAFIVAILLTFIALFPRSITNAGSLDQAQIILDRLSPNTSISGLICANPSSNQTENKTQINFPSDFTISNSTSNWLSSSSNIPSGSTAWPGTGSSAQSVSSKTVTFSSSDLSAGTRYCFRFSSSLSKTGTAGSKSLEIRTLDSSSNIIDSRPIAVHILNNDQVNVNATVPAKSSDLNVEVIKINPPGHLFQQDISMNMGINYSTNFDYPVDAVLVAEWEQGTFENQSSPSIDVVSYIPQTAKLAYGNSVPVIDLINRTITWTIDNLPGSVVHRTEFDFSVIRPYIGDLSINLPVSARLYVISAVKENTLNLVYRTNYQALTPPPGPTSTPAPSLTPTPIPRFYIGSVNINSISTNSASISVSFNKKAKAVIKYGTDPQSLISTKESPIYNTVNYLTLDGLKPDTKYYFKVEAESEFQQRQAVEIYTFKTAIPGNIPVPDKTSLIATSQYAIIYSKNLTDSLKLNTLLIPKSTPFTIQLRIDNNKLISKAQIKIISANVLGIRSDSDSISQINEAIDMSEVSEGVFIANLNSPSDPGIYTLTLKTYDYNGAILETPVVNVKVSKPLTVLDHNKNPIEQAIVKIKLLNPKTKLFEDFNFTSNGNNQLIKTNTQGTIDGALPPGKYQIEIEALGFKSKKIDFELGEEKGQDYPTIIMQPDNFSLLTFLKYHYETLNFNIEKSYGLIDEMSESIRLFSLINHLVITIFVLGAFIAFFTRIKLPIKHSINYLFHHGKKALKVKEKTQQIKIIDSETKNPISNCHIFVLDTKGKTIDISVTDKLGISKLNYIGKQNDLNLKIIRKGYKPVTHKLNYEEINYTISPIEVNSKSFKILNPIFPILDRSFEFLLFLGFAFEVIFAISLGVNKVLPFLILSLINLFIYLNHERITSHSSTGE